MTAFICNKDGCHTTNKPPKELQKLLDDWDKEIEQRIADRKLKGCWNPEAVKCDCPACGGYND